jgi:hypothetical protein
VEAKPLKNENDVSDLQLIVSFVCEGKMRVKIEAKKIKI